MKNRSKSFALATLILTLVLVVVSIKEEYPQKIWKRVTSNTQSNDDYLLSYSVRNRYWTLQERIDAAVKPVNIVLLGDSQTQFGDWNRLLGRADVLNLGLGGNVVPAMLSRVEMVLDQKPKICVVQGGVNDILQDVAGQITIEAFERIVDTLQSRTIVPILSTVAYTSRRFDAKNNVNAKIEALNRTILLLSAHKGVGCVDVNAVLASGRFADDRLVKPDDGLHYSDEGYRRVAEQIRTMLEQIER